MFNYGKVSEATISRLRQVLTDKGMNDYRANIKAGMTPRQSLRKIRDNSRISAQKYNQRNKEYFIAHVLPLVQLSLVEYINLLGADWKKRLGTYPDKQRKEIIKRWQAKDLDGAIANFVKRELETWHKEKNVFYRQHLRYFEEAIFYGLPYNKEACAGYELKELYLPAHSSVFEYRD